MNIVLIATNWSSQSGGINVFNQSLGLALARRLGNSGRVYCVIGREAYATLERKQRLVDFIPVTDIGPQADTERAITEIENWLRPKRKAPGSFYWVGHDLITGPLALRAAERVGGASVLIHHMSYAAYKSFEHSDAPAADRRSREQRALFRAGGTLFAVGPLLTRSCLELTGKTVIELIPGFAEFEESRPAPNSVFTAITFGRLEHGRDRIKQSRLATAAFAAAIKRATQNKPPLRALNRPRPRMFVIGLDEGAKSDEADLTALAEKKAGRAVMILPLPYDTNRTEVLHRIHAADVALMLSWHEGFGLAGWEAVAAEVPLIVSTHSGLYELVERELGGAGLGCLYSVDIEGQTPKASGEAFTRTDEHRGAEGIIEVSANLPHWKQNATTLKRLLIEKLGCSWQDTANTFLSGLGRGIRVPIRGGLLSASTPRIARPSRVDRSELSDRLQMDRWQELRESVRLNTISQIERENAGELRFESLQKYTCNGITLDVPSYVHTPSGIHLHLIFGGSFKMGDRDWKHEYAWCKAQYPDWQQRWSTRSTPAHHRRIQPFFLARFPVLQEQWDRYKHDLGLRDKRTLPSPRSPIDSVSWYDLQTYLIAVRLRLPSEADWEWACGAGCSARFFWGDVMDQRYCWYRENSAGSIHTVDEHRDYPNMFGLVDMLGNLWEWCSDDWIDDYKHHAPDSSPFATVPSARHASMRGGSWDNTPPTCRTRFRSHWAKEDRLNNSGFRVARDIFLA